MKSAALAFLTSLAAAILVAADSTPREALLVLSKGNHTLAIVDPSTLKVVATAPVGPDPHEVVASADGTVAYVSIYGGGAYNTIDRIDLVGPKPPKPSAVTTRRKAPSIGLWEPARTAPT